MFMTIVLLGMYEVLDKHFRLYRLEQETLGVGSEHMMPWIQVKPWTQVCMFISCTLNPKGSVLGNQTRNKHKNKTTTYNQV